MKCPNCNAVVEEKYNFCPKCRTKLKDNTTKAEERSPFTIVKNKAIWRIEKGEVARHINEAEFTNFEHVSGLIINEGVSAVICLNGKKVKELSGGIYDFVSSAEIEHILNQRVLNNESVCGLSKLAWRAIVRAWCGKKVGEVVKDSTNNNLKTIDDVICSLNENSFISVYLKLDRSFPALFGTKNGSDFLPINIKTKYLDAEFGVSMLVKIDDFDLFIRHYMVDKSSITINDIQEILKNYVSMILQDELRNEEIDEQGISKEARNRIMLRFMALSETLQGIQIVNVGDITCSNKDFERLRSLARELYCSEHELSYLKRINEFKNRLVGVENAQMIQEAKNDLELMKALDEVNRDKLLFQDEQEKFYVLLSRQKRIRNAQNEMEVSKALSDIKRIELLNEDEFEEFEQSLRLGKFERNNIHEAMRLQSLTTLNKKEIELNAEVIKCTIKQESGIEDTRFDAWKQDAAHQSEKIDIMDSFHGKGHVFNRKRLLEQQELTSLQNKFVDSRDLDLAIHKNKLLLETIKSRQLEDEYAWQKEHRKYLFEEEKIDNNDRREFKKKKDEIGLEEDRLKILEAKQAISLNGLARMKAMKNQEAEAEHKRKLEEEEQIHKHYVEKREVEHRKEILEKTMTHEEEMRRLENEGNYSAEQLFVIKNTDALAAREYASKFSSAKELEAERRAQEKIDEERAKLERERKEKEDRFYNLMEKQQADTNSMMDKVMNFAKHSMEVNAGVASGVVRNQQENEREHFNRYERISTYRMGELESYSEQRMDDIRTQKEEYRKQMKHEQQRHDLHQDKALSYTTKVTEAEYKSSHQPSIKEKSKRETEYYIEDMGPVPFQLMQLKVFIKKGMIDKSTVIQVAGAKYYAGDLAELKESFNENDYVVCPTCKKKIPQKDVSTFCPFCNNEI